MDVREKLVELFRNAFAAYGDGITGCTREEFFADFIAGYGGTVQQWISVKDRLPEKWQDIIVYDAKNQEIHLAYTTEDAWVGVRMNGKVTHWMPLPQPPKGE